MLLLLNISLILPFIANRLVETGGWGWGWTGGSAATQVFTKVYCLQSENDSEKKRNK